MNTKRFIALAGVCLLLAASAQAAAVSVNMYWWNWETNPGNNPTMGASDSAGAYAATNWNNPDDKTDFGTLNDDSGSSTTVTGNLTTGANSDSWNRPSDPVVERPYNNYFPALSNGDTLNLSGITYAVYDLYIYTGGWSDGSGTWTVGTTSASYSFSGQDCWDVEASGYVDGQDYIVLEGLTGSTMTATLSNDTGNSGFAAFQIVEVPEPATMSLLAIGGIALLRRKRR